MLKCKTAQTYSIMALMELSEEIANCMDNKKQAVGILIELQKACDTIDPNMLLTTLERYGIRGGD